MASRRKHVLCEGSGEPSDMAHKDLVICDSISGNTQYMATLIASHLGADLVQVESQLKWFSPLRLWLKLRRKTDGSRKVPIQTLQLERYRHIYLGSPIISCRPTAALFNFVRAANLQHKQVTLFNSYNGYYDPAAIEEFRQLTQRAGGQWQQHFAIKRGSPPLQLTRLELCASVNAFLQQSLKPAS